MKILYVIETLGAGGAERMLCTLASEQVRGGDEVTVAVLGPPLDLAGELEAAGVAVVVLPGHHRWNLFHGARRIASLAKTSGAAVVHAHLYFAAVKVGVARILGWTDAVTAVTFHNLAYRPGVNRPGPGLWLRRLLARMVYRFGFDHFIAVSRAVAGHYSRRLALPGIHVVHNAIDLRAFAPDCGQARADAHSGGPTVLLPGRLVRGKGHFDLLDALGILRSQGRDLKAVLAGGGPQHGALERRIEEAGLRESVRLTGPLSHSDMVSEMSGADVVVVPSRFEGFGLTALEALALARPVVASRAGGLPEVVEHERCGLLFDPGDAKALADAIGRLLDDPALAAAMGRAGRERVGSHFSAALAVERLGSIYRGRGARR